MTVEIHPMWGPQCDEVRVTCTKLKDAFPPSKPEYRVSLLERGELFLLGLNLSISTRCSFYFLVTYDLAAGHIKNLEAEIRILTKRLEEKEAEEKHLRSLSINMVDITYNNQLLSRGFRRTSFTHLRSTTVPFSSKEVHLSFDGDKRQGLHRPRLTFQRDDIVLS